MSGKRTSFSMGNEFNGYAGATYLKGTDRQSYPLLSQTDVRVLTSLDSLVVMALGAIPVYIDANQADLDMSMAVGAIPQVNMVQVTYNEKTGTTNQTFQVASSGVSTGSYFQGYSNNNNANIVEITPIGWLLFGTAGWKWGEETGTKKEGWLEDQGKGKWYYFRNEWMVTGWQLITYKGKSHWFYFNTKKDRQGVERAGDMAIGWIELNYNGENHWFYFHGNGTMAVDTWIDYRAKDGNWYYCGSNGTMRKSQLRVGNDGNLYYLKDDGAMAVNETITDPDSGVTYYADENGVCTEKKTASIPIEYYMGTSEREQMKYIFGVDPGSQSWSKFSESLKNEKGKNNVTIEVPVWKLVNGNKVKAVKELTVHKKVQEVVVSIFTDIYNSSEKFPIDDGTTAGQANRNNTTSLHNYGIAIDINWDANAMYNEDGTIRAGKYYKPGTAPLSIPSNSSVVATFKKYGWYWGGNWKSTPDYMHFAYMNH